MKSDRVEAIFQVLEAADPDPQTELLYTTPFTLLLAVRLSAQAPDASVNKVMGPLMDQLDTPEKVVGLGVERVAEMFKTLNFYRTKARNAVQIAQILIERYMSQVPLVFEDLVQLPGIGQKTANVVLNVLAGASRIAVDTHVFRVAHRLGIATASTPTRLEAELYTAIPKKYWGRANHWLVLHGRRVCKARAPQCTHCILRAHCCFAHKNVAPAPRAF